MTRVLVVDDSPTTRRIVRRALVMSGVPEMGISEAEDGREALNKICAEKPSLVLSDVNMPIMDGFQLLTEMGSRGLMDRTSVVVITSRSSKKDRGRLLELGAKTVIKKPFPVHALGAYIAPYLVTSDEVAAESVDEPDIEAEGSTAPRDEAIGQALSAALSHTLELTAFLDVVPVDVTDLAEDAVFHYSELSLTLGVFGRLWVAAPADSIELFAHSGTEENGHRSNCVARHANALAELVNVLAGEFCSEYLGDEAEFEFGLPSSKVLLTRDSLLDDGYVFGLDGGSQLLLAGLTPTNHG